MQGADVVSKCWSSTRLWGCKVVKFFRRVYNLYLFIQCAATEYYDIMNLTALGSETFWHFHNK